MESAVSRVKSSMSSGENLRDVLVIDGGEGVATLENVLAGGGGTKGEAVVARGGVVLRSAFLDTGDKEAGEGWRIALVGAAFFRRDDFIGVGFVELSGRSVVDHADLVWGFMMEGVPDFCRPACLEERRVEDGFMMFVVCLVVSGRGCRMIRIGQEGKLKGGGWSVKKQRIPDGFCKLGQMGRFLAKIRKEEVNGWCGDVGVERYWRTLKASARWPA